MKTSIWKLRLFAVTLNHDYFTPSAKRWKWCGHVGVRSHDYTAINPASMSMEKLTLDIRWAYGTWQDNKLVPALAEKWGVLMATSHTWTFHLRDGLEVPWRKGSLLEDVKKLLVRQSLDRQRKIPEIVSELSRYANITCPVTRRQLLLLSKCSIRGLHTTGILLANSLWARSSRLQLNQPVGAGQLAGMKDRVKRCTKTKSKTSLCLSCHGDETG